MRLIIISNLGKLNAAANIAAALPRFPSLVWKKLTLSDLKQLKESQQLVNTQGSGGGYSVQSMPIIL